MIYYNRKNRFDGELNSLRELKFYNVLKWKMKDIFKKEKAYKKLKLFSKRDKLFQKQDYISWLGHASFILQLNSKKILIDPVFGDIPFYKRDIPAPYKISEIPKVDIVLLSHTHYDHFDKVSIRAIAHKDIIFLVPIGMKKLLKKIIKIPFKCYELEWWEAYRGNDIKITLVPAKHWSRRGLFDTNQILWGGFVIQANSKTVYFSGDTAFDKHFELIAKSFKIDIALLPIGAYKPENVMKYNHLNPQEAFKAFNILEAKIMIPMHYGTFKLSAEALDEPRYWMEQIAKKSSKKIYFLETGEVLI